MRWPRQQGNKASLKRSHHGLEGCKGEEVRVGATNVWKIHCSVFKSRVWIPLRIWEKAVSISSYVWFLFYLLNFNLLIVYLSRNVLDFFLNYGKHNKKSLTMTRLRSQNRAAVGTQEAAWVKTTITTLTIWEGPEGHRAGESIREWWAE